MRLRNVALGDRCWCQKEIKGQALWPRVCVLSNPIERRVVLIFEVQGLDF